MQEIIDSVLLKIKPSLTEKKNLEKNTDIFVRKLQERIKDAEVFIGGSYAKGTYLKNIKDIDIFVCFDYLKFLRKKNKIDISEILGDIIKSIYPDVERLHGSRDYYRVYSNNIVFEVIPILKIDRSEEAENITDISPLHVRWVKSKKIDPDQIRLAKAFCKAQRVYGAESYIKGFSGYSLEVLVIYYKSFTNFIKSASKWKKPIMIDPERYHKDILKEVNPSKMTGPLVLIDPVEAGRNAAAGLSEEKFNLFIDSANKFLEKPSESFFKRKEIDLKSLKESIKKDNKLIYFEIRVSSGKEDVVGCKLLKIFEHMKRYYEMHEFKIKDSGWNWDKANHAFIWFMIEKSILSRKIIREGPPVHAKENFESFMTKHKESFIKDGRVFSEIERKFKTPLELSEWFTKDNYIIERIEEIKLLFF